MENSSSMKISKRAFLTTAAIILSLMMIAGILTVFVPSGMYDRQILDGREVIVSDSFEFGEKPDYPFYRWLTAPIEVLASDDAVNVITIIIFITAIAGAFYCLEKSGILAFTVSRIVIKYRNRKYMLLAVYSLVFMAFGSTIGTFEEMVAILPLSIALAISLGWDSLVGMGMSLMAACFGFAAATFNPFTIGISHKLVGLPMFSGVIFRLPIFAVIYLVLLHHLFKYARKIDKDISLSLVFEEEKNIRQKYSYEALIEEKANQADLKKASRVFLYFLLAIFAMLFVGFLAPAVAALSMPILAILFLIGGLSSSFIAKNNSHVLKDFINGVKGIAPAALLILMAMSVKLIITNGGILDTLLFYASGLMKQSGAFSGVMLVYGVVLLLNFFIGSGSAKAFLVIPILAPLSDLMNLSKQVLVQAFCFGDGFSNVLFPTNPVLMIALSMTVISYSKWLKWSIWLQLKLFAITSIILMIAVAVNYP